MPIGKSKISDMDFASFENTIDKNIETDKASDKFDQQLQAYKDAGNSLTLAKSELETAASFGFSCRVSFILSFQLSIL